MKDRAGSERWQKRADGDGLRGKAMGQSLGLDSLLNTGMFSWAGK